MIWFIQKAINVSVEMQGKERKKCGLPSTEEKPWQWSAKLKFEKLDLIRY